MKRLGLAVKFGFTFPVGRSVPVLFSSMAGTELEFFMLGRYCLAGQHFRNVSVLKSNKKT